MPDWVARHRSSIRFTVWMVIGITLIAVGVINNREPAMIALGAGAVGLPGFSTISADRVDP
jgi:hypothetical protein